MSKTFYETLIQEFKRSSQSVKIKKATKYGFSSVEEYLEFLESQLNGNQEVAKQEKKKDVLVIDLLDRSVSMNSLDRITHAVEGIKKGISNLIEEEGKDVTYGYILRDFGDRDKGKEILGRRVSVMKMSDSFSSTIDRLTSSFHGSTALNDAIIDVCNIAINHIGNKTDNVLINIYTDGEENSSNERNKKRVLEMIRNAEKTGKITVTFIGTERDVKTCISLYGIDESNTLSYDGTGVGLAKAMADTVVARSTYSSKVAKGEEVKTGFYKTLNKK